LKIVPEGVKSIYDAQCSITLCTEVLSCKNIRVCILTQTGLSPELSLQLLVNIFNYWQTAVFKA
jgi:hypothetical protein